MSAKNVISMCCELPVAAGGLWMFYVLDRAGVQRSFTR